MKLYEYVNANTIRGACTCGKCIDAPEDPESKQPEGHTADMIFFKVAKKPEAKADAFKKLVEEEFPHWLDQKEHSYLETGADIGDQGTALMAMGLGSLLGIWTLLTPRSMLGNLIPENMIMQMAGQGYVSIQVKDGVGK